MIVTHSTLGSREDNAATPSRKLNEVKTNPVVPSVGPRQFYDCSNGQHEHYEMTLSTFDVWKLRLCRVRNIRIAFM